MKDSLVRRGAQWMGLVLFVTVAGCGGDSPTGGDGDDGGDIVPVVTTSVNIVDAAFTPPNIQVTGGQAVTWTWVGSLSHNVTFTNASIGNSLTQTGGSYVASMPTSPGVYPYNCTVHGFSGTVTVP